jgi:hypothetical protein
VVAEDYASQRDYVSWVKADAEARQEGVENALRAAFSRFMEVREVDVIVFSDMTAGDVASAILSEPLVLKSLLACCNVAARAIERDLDIKNLDTYMPRLSEAQANMIAGYIKPFLPAYVELPVLSRLDRVSFIDKEIRKLKGRWELGVLKALNRFGRGNFRKRKFRVGDEEFEIDAASPEGGYIRIGIDVKRIEARRDIHKRCDEIVNKARKLKSAFPDAQFGVVMYYPFPAEHVNIQSRLRSPEIDAVVFASGSGESIGNAVKMLLSTLRK